MEKSEVILKIVICTLLWSENIKFYIFTSENIKYTLYFINIFLYFTTLYIINNISSPRNPKVYKWCGTKVAHCNSQYFQYQTSQRIDGLNVIDDMSLSLNQN